MQALPSADKSELALSDNDWRLERLSQCQSMSSTVPSTPYDMIPPGEGALPYISQWTCAGLKGRFFSPFWSENKHRLCPFWSGIGYGF